MAEAEADRPPPDAVEERSVTELAACTIVARNYLPYARTLARSFRAVHPRGRFTVLLADRDPEGELDPRAEPFELLRLEELGVPGLEEMAFQYDLLELSTALKPYLLERLLDAGDSGSTKLLYLDPDILVLGALDGLAHELDRHDVLLTPHILRPYRDAETPGEVDLLQCGTHNLGFIGVRDGEPTRELLTWWQERCRRGCLVLREHGYFVDQKWMDLAPSLFPGVHVLRDPGYNVAYWNLHERRVASLEPPRLASGPLHFFHFSGFQFDDPTTLSRYQTRWRLADRPELEPLFSRYRGLLAENGYARCRDLPWAFGRFDDGTPIPAPARRLWLSLSDEDRASFGNPFEAGAPESFARWLQAPARMARRHRPRGHRTANRAWSWLGRAGARTLPSFAAVTNLAYYVHQSDPDVRARFPDPFGRDRQELLRWSRNRWGETSSEPPAGENAGLHAGAALEPAFRARPRLRRRTHGASALLRRGAFGVNVAGYLTTESGVGQAARSMVHALDAADVPRALWNFDRSHGLSQEDTRFDDFSATNPYRFNLVHVNADQVRTFRKEVGRRWFRGHRNIGFWLWELPEFPDRWVSRFRHFDEIWTPSRFCAEALAAKSPVPVLHVPVALDADPERVLPRAAFDLPEDRRIFLFCFDAASFVERKNPMGLVEAFQRAFPGPRDDVLLVLKVTNGQRNPEALEKLRKRAAEGPIRVLDAQLRSDAVRSLIRCCDAYVSLHRSEGFGLTLAEAMAHARPVIATAWSGNADFTGPETALPVRHRLVEIEKDVGPYGRGQHWAEPDLDHAAERMRWVVEHPDEAAALGARASRRIREQLSPERIGEQVRDRLERTF